MKAKILDHEAWKRLELEAEANPLCAFVSPNNMAVVVVEDDDGKIVASMGVPQITHFEGLWVAPKWRGNPGVMRALLRRAGALAHARGETWVIGGAADRRMREYGDRLGARIEADFYSIPV